MAEQNKSFSLGAGARTVGWVALAAVCAVAALNFSFFGILLAGAAVYSGYKAYQSKQDERTQMVREIAQNTRSAPDLMPQQPFIAQEPAQQASETKWQAAVSKTSSPAQGTGRGA